MRKLVTMFLAIGLFTGCSAKQNPELVTVNKRDLYQLTYEWAMYREVAILEYAKMYNVSKEEATQHLEEGINNAVEKQFISWYENREKWEKK